MVVAAGDRSASAEDDERRAPRARTLLVLAGALVVLTLLAGGGRLAFEVSVGANERVQTWSTVFVAIVLQSIPFLVLGVALSAAVAAFVPQGVIDRALPSRPILAVPVAGVAGAVLPGCECASVPVAGRMIAGGVAQPAALTFLLSAPAINPVVLVATAVAFPQMPMVVLARFVASLGVAVVMGLLWSRFGRPEWLLPPLRLRGHGGSRWDTFQRTAQYDFLHAGGFLIVGAVFAATLNVVIEPAWTAAVAGDSAVSLLVLAGLAVVLSLCSEADAFVVAGLAGFPITAKLAFMVVGPAVDLKLAAMQWGTFGPRFAIRFAPATFVVAVVVSSAVGWLLL